MELQTATPGQLLAGIGAALDQLQQLGAPLRRSDPDRLDEVTEAVRLQARLHSWVQQQVAHLEADEVALRQHGTSTATWLMSALNLTHREAAEMLRSGQELVRFPIVGAGAATGEVLPQQAQAITGVLAQLPAHLPTESLTHAQHTMAGFAQTHNSTELRRLSRHLLDVVAPDIAQATESAALERQHRQAMRDRHLTFTHDHAGSVLIRGSLPAIDAHELMVIVDAYAAQRGLDAIDPAAEYVTPAMRRADGLLAMVRRHAQRQLAPSHGGDRPRLVITLSYDKLVKAAADGHALHAQLNATGEPLPAGVLRRLLCDADVLPTVLGGASQPLDVGRTSRLATPAIRAALEVRDGGCIFPGCDKPPEACEAHHRIPWWAGGPTALRNLVLLCPHHHGICEPGHDPTADRWRVEFRNDGLPHVVPPRRVDPRQRPRQHVRFLPRVEP